MNSPNDWEPKASVSVAVVIWGVLLTAAALLLGVIRANNPDSDLIKLAFGMLAYTYGPLLGILLASLVKWKVSPVGLMVGTILSMLLVSWFRPEVVSILELFQMPDLAKAIVESRPKLASEWFFPLNAGITLLCGLLGGRRRF